MNQKNHSFESPIPIVRIFDEDKAREFYLHFLEFALDWEHRFEADFPIYMQISKDECTIHLSEHHGDCSPGTALRIKVHGIDEWHQKLLRKQYKFARPGLERTPWNTKEVTLIDPFHNKLIFYEQL